jgi:hypothetical protein
MDGILAPLAFAMLIGGQFLAAIVVISKRETIYGIRPSAGPADQHPRATQCTNPDVARDERIDAAIGKAARRPTAA